MALKQRLLKGIFQIRHVEKKCARTVRSGSETTRFPLAGNP